MTRNRLDVLGDHSERLVRDLITPNVSAWFCGMSRICQFRVGFRINFRQIVAGGKISFGMCSFSCVFMVGHTTVLWLFVANTFSSLFISSYSNPIRAASTRFMMAQGSDDHLHNSKNTASSASASGWNSRDEVTRRGNDSK
jgi:hypothetical protein